MPLNYTLASVEKNIGVPITRQIVELVLKNIEMHALEPGDRLPTERELAQRLGVARGTVKSAYKKLEEQDVVRTRQGSGSYIVRDEELARKLRKEKAVELLEESIGALSAMGLGRQEIFQLFDACLALKPGRAATVAVISDAPELLLDLKRQMSFFQGVAVSLFIMESITENPDPESLLRSFGVILTTAGHYREVAALLPGLKERVQKVGITPSPETLINLSGLSRGSRIGIISRSSTYLALIKKQLWDYGFQEEQVQSFFEMDYTIETYFPGGIDVLISFGDAHIFTNPAFHFRNEEFEAKGGKIIAFRHQLQRQTVYFLEDRLRRLASNGLR